MSNAESGQVDAKPVTLEGEVVRLEPLRREHAPLLWDVAKDALDDIFRWIPYAMRTAEDLQNGIEKILAEQASRQSIAFATVERRSGHLIGSTRFMNMDLANRRVEIGSTWIAPAWQRTAANTEAKYLMLRHAFEQWRCLRVELKTDALNQRSRAAILRLGAKRRRHTPPTHGDLGWPQTRLGVLQHSGFGVAASESQAGRKVGLRSQHKAGITMSGDNRW
jgi:RimJ/RimL family protein N-acetyltransferase